MNALYHDPASWFVPAITVGIVLAVCLLEFGEDARRWFVRRVLRRGVASPDEEVEETAAPPVIRSLHRDRSLRGGALARYTSEGRALPTEPVRRPRIGR